MRIGDKVYIWDTQSDLFIRKGEVVEIRERKALVMIITGQIGRRGCIADWFEMDKLHRLKRGRRGRRNAS